MSGEILDLIDENDQVVGRASRSEVHGNPALLHRVVHVLVFDFGGRVFLQKRSEDKDVQPGKWDTSVGGHVDAEESRKTAVRRELREELGIPPEGRPAPSLTFLHAYRHENDYESELVTTWMCRWDGPFHLQESEISDGRFWSASEIESRLELKGEESPFTPNFTDEWRRWHRAGCPRPE
ncbi:MAG: NUDIX domain-containing protein [Spirochaetaceae bacterium]|nr:NUDIX domain-containing protein [Spirochaetaceae bacterium]